MAQAAIFTAQMAAVQATKVSGTIVKLEPTSFVNLLANVDKPLIITAYTGLFSKKHHYLTSYKGLTFYTLSVEKLPVPETSEIIEAESIWVPDL